MKLGALISIIVSAILIFTLTSFNINAGNISFVSTLVVVVIVAFTLSALLQKVKQLTTAKKYGISGAVGVIAGILYYIWASEHVEAMVVWIHKYGVSILLIMIILSAVYLFKNNRLKA